MSARALKTRTGLASSAFSRVSVPAQPFATLEAKVRKKDRVARWPLGRVASHAPLP